MRKFAENTLVIASHNAGKVREIQALLSDYAVNVISAAELNLVEPEETEDTFVGNATLKALYTARATNLPALADDSGLSVDALGGRPGVHTAPYAEREPGVRDFAYGMAKLETEMQGHTNRAAQFNCVLALAWPDAHVEVVTGQVAGTLRFPPSGDQGFGFDPVFVPDGHDITFGNMDPDKKHAMSHRAVAFAKLVKACFETSFHES